MKNIVKHLCYPRMYYNFNKLFSFNYFYGKR